MVFWKKSVSHFYYQFFIGDDKIGFYQKKILKKEKRNNDDNKAY